VDSELVDEVALGRQLAIDYASVRSARRLSRDGRLRGRQISPRGLQPRRSRRSSSPGITVNVIESGFIGTEMNPADGPAATLFLPTTAMGRYGRPEEIAAGDGFLAGPQAACVTGAVLRIDGGYAGWRDDVATAVRSGRRWQSALVYTKSAGRAQPLALFVSSRASCGSHRRGRAAGGRLANRRLLLGDAS
jgi:hypothetical protein